jgi:phosphonoacetate hydrolase
MNQMSPVIVSANGRSYAWPRVPAIGICLDGCEPAYLDEAIKAGLMPALVRIKEKGTVRTAYSVIPSFTNPNNLSIATGRPPSVHGICGNYLYERETGKEVMMNDPRFLRGPTIFKAYCDAGARVAVVTAKDKLRALLGHGLDLPAAARCAFRRRSRTRRPWPSTASTMPRSISACRCRKSIRPNCRNSSLPPASNF